MDVVIHSSGLPFNGQTVYERSLGGSETAAYYLARELARRGHRVRCFTSERQESECEGVSYIWHGPLTAQSPLGERFEHYAINTPHDVLVIQRTPAAFHKQFSAKICIWQLHDLALYRNAAQVLRGTWQINAITTVSEWHRQQVLGVWGLDPSIVHVVPNGVDPALYAPDRAPAFEWRTVADGATGRYGFTEDRSRLDVPSGRFMVLYQSRPERGLAEALQLMERAQALGLPLHLLVCGYDNTTPSTAGLYAALDEKAASLPNVTRLGALSKPELATLQRRCDLLLYPTAFEEVSCITAMEAMHAGLPMLTSAVAALPETCAGSGTELVPLTQSGAVDLDAFENWLVSTFMLVREGEYPQRLAQMRRQQIEASATRTWSHVAAAFEALVEQCFESARSSDGAILRTAIEHGDIGFAAWYANRAKSVDAIVAVSRRELAELYAFKDTAESYAAHYATHQGIYYDKHEREVIGEDVTRTTRFRGTMALVADHIEKRKAGYLRILDYGCAHGHYAIPIARAFPGCDVVGVDISERAIAAARTWAQRDGVTNVEFHRGAQEWLANDENGTFDVIVMGEVVEHVWQYGELLNLARSRLAPDGVLVITTPSGRWEHSGTEAFRTAREHLHHFERADIDDICAGHEYTVLQAPAGHDRSGFALGSWVWAVWPKPGVPLWNVNYERKLKTYVPRQTISACLIVRDAEKTLRRCVESFVDWVDEIIIMIDPATTDRTVQIAAQLARDFPYRAWIYRIANKSAQRDGFDEARNESIECASGDWILWVDADEEIRRPWNLHMLARRSLHNGYGFAQVHYSVDPDQVLTVDYPSRLFRNRMGIRFYGVVHEHPEQQLGKAVPHSVVRPEVKFLHHGYFDEETRRARYRRNLPLLMRDVQKFPTERPLNRFLHLRDIAQGIQFEAERTGLQPHHVERAREGIRLMEQILELPQTKIVIDAMPYYSLCVATTGSGFEADVTMKTRVDTAPDLAANVSISGRFHSREFYQRLLAKFSQEITAHYEDRHL